jgi:hypothetical protein
MGLNWQQKPGVNHVGEFQVSGHVLPVAASTKVSLNYVGSSITATASGGNGTLTFYDGNDQTGAITIKEGATVRFTGKFLKFSTGGNTTALVEVTNIPKENYTVPRFGILSGSS